MLSFVLFLLDSKFSDVQAPAFQNFQTGPGPGHSWVEGVSGREGGCDVGTCIVQRITGWMSECIRVSEYDVVTRVAERVRGWVMKMIERLHVGMTLSLVD